MIDLDNLEDSISRIYDHYYLDVYRFLICFSGNQSDAEDMTQEVFIRVLHNLGSFNSDGNLKTWIISIAKHVAVDNYRKKRFYAIFKDSFFNQVKSTEKGPNDIYEQNEMRNVLHEAISNLKPNYRTVVILRGINEFSIKESAQILGCSESKVKVNYHRALKDLKKKLFFEFEEVIRNAK
ncbi:RNA polymerase sigma factor [Sutcliffiella sp. NC1]|uniref:RNA polymerase sigma factor n=1 Tax=Sutcliffiella sp. NC1 TaxID=3004096 RepID=UPI0022DE01D5|nr:sigma-70 family RNA polymerase sigma factor [Sutcliffiella sp. NC1]WBL16609.1 sigma-70 family RNA polymerase sigma factor [Sutcliffiella sp. NC1]